VGLRKLPPRTRTDVQHNSPMRSRCLHYPVPKPPSTPPAARPLPTTAPRQAPLFISLLNRMRCNGTRPGAPAVWQCWREHLAAPCRATPMRSSCLRQRQPLQNEGSEQHPHQSSLLLYKSITCIGHRTADWHPRPCSRPLHNAPLIAYAARVACSRCCQLLARFCSFRLPLHLLAAAAPCMKGRWAPAQGQVRGLRASSLGPDAARSPPSEGNATPWRCSEAQRAECADSRSQRYGRALGTVPSPAQ
jgi:hypothetical protein